MFFYSFPIIKMSFFLSYNLISFMPFPCYKKTVPFPDYFLNRIFYSTEGIIRYLGRYRARSPVAEYKITEIDDGKVTFFFNDLANNKKKTYITIPAEKFISQILIHLPPKNFKMVNSTVSIQDIFLMNLKRLWSLLGKIFPYQNIHFIRGRCT